jgi:hypothetical protein
MATWESFIGSVVSVTTTQSQGSDVGVESDRHKSSRILTGMLCAVEPESRHLMLLRLVEADPPTSSEAERRVITLLHPQFVSSVKVLNPMPENWRLYLAAEQSMQVASSSSDASGMGQEQGPSLKDVVALLEENMIQHSVVVSKGESESHLISVFGGELTIKGPPYNSQNCISTNAIILRRVRKLISYAFS